MSTKRFIFSLLLACTIHAAFCATTNRIVLSNGVPVTAGPDTRRNSLDGHTLKRFLPATNAPAGTNNQAR